ncbi:DUF4391 domain-containing protein [Aliivibrio sp. S2TY2]|uniref:DUF4391 domain-containing protein n=1 Tax=unclassified Aliivibrio TaxID=2645654 RepID=UPI00237849E4|nr:MULTISPECIES: DUF4391 domain-containing protein [unclassified Aliivibrio]MDD9176047.1 DUF4391 domain-containing protein [Aliivibrio sp. S3TY1]MDD9193039.1 DUF4391 domain-containing protein [Aliivibrio sp. S2TY2]
MELIDFRNNDKTEHNSLIEKVCENLALPDSTFLGTRITKKMLVDNNELSSHDKKLVTDVIQSIVWQNTLKPETLNVPVYVTETVEYIEIAVIRVVLKSDIKNKIKLKNVAKLLHTLIPYPVILLLELGEELAISLADKRINQADKSKLVIEHIYNSDWLSSTGLTENENNFLNDFSLKNISNINYFEFYQDLISMLIGIEASKISGRYVSKIDSPQMISENSNDSGSELREEKQTYDTLTETASSFVEKSNEDKTALLRELEGLEAELSSIRSKIKKETQMNTKMRLNVQARKVKQAISAITSQLA